MADTEPTPTPAAGAPAEPEEDENGLAVEEEAQVEFQPLVKLEEVKTTTGEDDEEVTFKMRAKLFRWESDSWEKEVKMWKERGTGDVRIMKHKTTGKVRMLMRREKTMKICANFMLLPSIVLKENAGSDRSWVWQCMDFSEEKTEQSVLAIRFANSENAAKFKEVFEEAKEIMAKLVGDEPPPAAKPAEEAKEEAAPAPAEEKKDEDAEAAPSAAADEAAEAVAAVKLDEKKEEAAAEIS